MFFSRHIDEYHSNNDKSAADLRVQKNVVAQLEVQVRKEKDILHAMLSHLNVSSRQTIHGKDVKIERVIKALISNFKYKICRQ